MVRQAHDDELVMSLVEMALSKPAPERRSYVSSACGEDTELQEVVWRYVESEQSMNGFLLSPLCPPLEIEDPFEPGQLLDGRFRIVRELARGGMGIVYEAYDERLDRRIALKCARAGFRKRLPPEVRHASDISHPNVCKIYEIHTAATRQGEVDFLTMEFVDGETLAEKVKRGPLAEEVARKVALQICEGLAEAHRKEVIHGDLKSANVIVAADESGGVRAVITDFGLAQRPRGGAWPLVVGGTPDYMAPELWKGAKSSVATDIYALGVILRELAYGQDAEVAQGKPKWDAVIAGCMKEEPGRRFASASDVASALAPRTRRWAMAAAAAVLVGVVSGAVTYRTATGPSETVRLAVAPFESSSEMSALARGLHASTLKRAGDIRDSRKTQIEVLTPGEVDRATHTLSARLKDENGGTLLTAYVKNKQTAVSVREWSATYAPGETKHIPEALAGLVTGTFHLPALSANVNDAAKQGYETGILYLRQDSTLDLALPILEKAAAADPNSPLMHAALTNAYMWKSRETGRKEWQDRAGQALNRALARNPDLAPVLIAGGFYQTYAGRFEMATGWLLRAVEIEPANGDAHRRLANVYQASGESDKALIAYRRAIEVEPQYYRHHQALSYFFQQRADYAEAIKHLRRSVELAPLEPTAHSLLGYRLMSHGQFVEAEQALRRSLDLGESPEALNTLAAVLTYQQRDQESVTYLNRAAQWWPDRYLVWLNLGTSYRRLGLHPDAERAYRRGLELARSEMSTIPRSGYIRACAAYMNAWLGNRIQAESELAQAMQLSPNNANVLRMAVKVYEALGQRDQSIALLKRVPDEVRADIGRFPDLADLHRDLRFQALNPPTAGKP